MASQMHDPLRRVEEPLASLLPTTPEAAAAVRTSTMAHGRLWRSGALGLAVVIMLLKPAARAGLWRGLDVVLPIGLMAAVWVGTMLWRRRTVRKIIGAQGVACPWCAYDLQSGGFECVCPECGHSVNQHAAREAWDVLDPQADAACGRLQWRTVRRAVGLSALPVAGIAGAVVVQSDTYLALLFVGAISCWLGALFVLQHDRELVYARGVARQGRVCPACLTDLRDTGGATSCCDGCGRSWRIGSVVGGWARFAELRRGKVL